MADVQMGLRMPEARALNDVEEELIDYDDDTIDQTDATLVEVQVGASAGTTTRANMAPTRCDFETGEVVARKGSITEAELVSSEGHELGDPAMSPNIPPEAVVNSERAQIGECLEPGTTNSASAGNHAPHPQGNSDIEDLSQDNVLDRGQLNDSTREVSEPAEQYNGCNQLALESTGGHPPPESPGLPCSTEHMAFEETDADEITWEEPLVTTEAEQIEDPEDSHELSLVEEISLDVSGGQVINPPDEDDATVGLAEAEDIDFGQDTTTGPSDQRSVDGQAEDASTMQQDSAGADVEPFPSITVQYKGDEFPLLSSTSEGFFSDVSVLGETLESLLAGFRVELANELATDEELVYQVDELGLEYAESSTRDILCNVTLRQILEVFDLLVKNQDPESSRVLYTYLFAKPSTSKRYESLLESATAGVGLDEVCHLFESPMPQTTTARDYLSIDDELDEMLENYESGSDENNCDEVEKAEQVSPQEETFGQPHETGEIISHHEGAVPEESESALHSDYSIAGATKIICQHDNYPGETFQEDAHLSEPESQLTGSAGCHEDIDGHTEHYDAAIDVYDTGLRNDKAQADEVVDLYADDVGLVGDLNAEDELDEIDWREDAPEGAISTDISASTAKRNRSDESLDAEDEKDAKRLRS